MKAFYLFSTVARAVLYTAVRKMHCRQVAVKKIEKILVPTDLSERSLGGVGYAFNLAKTLGAEVIVLQASRLMLLLSDMGARRPSFTVDL